ncbi:MAG: hypothetical protein J0I24_01990 [Thiomonas arsenitoxydans]|uniref:DUF1453 domain-containing protein n=1 Tax=Thiomonas arsenitoxydans (strain DSM 22701 / CIP 110005 / 3As) TaxID=426114 RepID=A0A8I1MUX4_THIA3|nr:MULTISPECIES: hypothetical protein [Thiomonas]MBN8743056.1 hypothetical protein [Thiomonas arsenitoxydans]ODU98713.1 MAG: hypothetical protein ABT24_00615 [Thiomonas sp. SCN 64-16]
MNYLQHIPTYVYVVFIVLMWMGVARCYPRSIRVERLTLMPTLIVILAVRAYLQLFPQPGLIDLAACILGTAVGIRIGWQHARGWVVQVNLETRRLAVPGDILMLGIIFGAFVFEFALHFGIATHAAWIELPVAQPGAAFIWAWLAGMTVGRNVNLGLRYRAAVQSAAKLSEVH